MKSGIPHRGQAEPYAPSSGVSNAVTRSTTCEGGKRSGAAGEGGDGSQRKSESVATGRTTELYTLPSAGGKAALPLDAAHQPRARIQVIVRTGLVPRT